MGWDGSTTNKYPPQIIKGLTPEKSAKANEDKTKTEMKAELQCFSPLFRKADERLQSRKDVLALVCVLR